MHEFRRIVVEAAVSAAMSARCDFNRRRNESLARQSLGDGGTRRQPDRPLHHPTRQRPFPGFRVSISVVLGSSRRGDLVSAARRNEL